MKKLLILNVVIICFPVFTMAGEIYGTLKIGSETAAKDIRVEIESAEGKKYEGATDSYGSYSIYVNETGSCTLSVYFEGHSSSIVVYSYQESVRYNLVLLKNENGYYLKRQ